MKNSLPKTIYHTTLAINLPKILVEGLSPNKSESSQKVIYFSGSEGTARNYACMRANQEHVLLEITTSKLDKNKFGPDDYELQDYLDDIDDEEDLLYDTAWADYSGIESITMCDQVVYGETIPPECITIIDKSFYC